MSQVVWLPEALEHLIRLRSFLEDKSPQAAMAMQSGSSLHDLVQIQAKVTSVASLFCCSLA